MGMPHAATSSLSSVHGTYLGMDELMGRLQGQRDSLEDDVAGEGISGLEGHFGYSIGEYESMEEQEKW